MELWPWLVKLADGCSLATIAQLHLINRMQKNLFYILLAMQNFSNVHVGTEISTCS